MKPIHCILFSFFLFINYGCSSQQTLQRTPFFKMYSGKMENKDINLYLYRDTPYSSPLYSGYIIDTSIGIVHELGGTPEDSSDNASIGLKIAWSKDTIYDLSCTLSDNGERLEGSVSVSVKENKMKTSSIRFSEIKPAYQFAYYSASTGFTVDSSGVTSNYDIGFVWPSGWKNEAAAKLIQDSIGTVLGIRRNVPDPLAEFVKGAKAEFDETVSNGRVSPGEQTESSTTEKSTIFFCNDIVASIGTFGEHYESGMNHANWWTYYAVYNLHTGKKLKLSDILTASALQRLPLLMEKYFKKEYKIKLDEPLTKAGLFKNQIPINKNFYITNKQLVFHYNNYEIAPFSEGEFTVPIPLSEFNSELTLQP